MIGYLQLNFDKCTLRGYNASKVIGRFVDVNSILLSEGRIIRIGPRADIFLQFFFISISTLISNIIFTFFLMVGEQNITDDLVSSASVPEII